jgi:dTDP-4-dehydrorhamnose 3,5-epimerase
MPFSFTKLPLDGLVLVEPRVYTDGRGFFLESYKESEFAAAGIDGRFVQDNHSLSRKNVLRGLHFQRAPKAQGKLVRVIKGTVWDVAVDIRKESPTFKRWHGIELSAENGLMLYIPPGFAHGFLALSDEVHLIYKCTEEYDAALDAGSAGTIPTWRLTGR